MKKLCLMRHAKSSWQNSELTDFDRPLNNRGLSDAPMMGERLAAMGLSPDHIISSAATRALVTARTIAETIGYDVNDIHADEALYLADTDTLYEVIGQLDDACTTVILFGHNPGFTYLANQIGDAHIDNMPTCSIAVFELNISNWSKVAPHCGKLLFFDFPKNHKKT